MERVSILFFSSVGILVHAYGSDLPGDNSFCLHGSCPQHNTDRSSLLQSNVEMSGTSSKTDHAHASQKSEHMGGDKQAVEACVLAKHAFQSNASILLTMHNAANSREMYNDVVSYYSELFSPGQLFAVDSANHGVDGRLIRHQRVFSQDKVCAAYHQYCNTTTFYELCSLKEALELLPLNDSGYIFKLTAKYKLPRLKEIMETLPDAHDFLFQARHADLDVQNTELLGARKSTLTTFVDWALEHIHSPDGVNSHLGRECQHNILEHQLLDFIQLSPGLRVCRLPSLVNIASYHRGFGDFLQSVL